PTMAISQLKLTRAIGGQTQRSIYSGCWRLFLDSCRNSFALLSGVQRTINTLRSTSLTPVTTSGEFCVSSPTQTPTVCVGQRLRDVGEVLGQWQHVGHLEESDRLRMHNVLAMR